MGMEPQNHSLRFKNPPVVWVRLGIDFESLLPIQGWQLEEFFAKTSSAFTDRKEVAPFPVEPLKVSAEPSGADQVFYEAGGADWPIPRTILSNSQTVLEVQANQICLGWNFSGRETGDGAPYPGFDSLRSQILEIFETLNRSVVDSGGDIFSKAVHCIYLNSIEESPVRLSTGVLAQWAGYVDGKEHVDDYLGVRIHQSASESVPMTSTVMVDAEPGQKPRLGFEVSRAVHEETVEKSFDEAHTKVLSLFDRYTDPTWREDWDR